jgi:hypothetical protein
LNVARRNETVACDIVYSDTPAVNDGSVAAVIFIGIDLQGTYIYGIKIDKQFVNTLEVGDCAQVIISYKIVDILRTLCIKSWKSESYQQQQNPAKRRYQTLKTAAHRIMDCTGAPPKTWLLSLHYVCFLLNHTFNTSINNFPLNQLTGTQLILVNFSAFISGRKFSINQLAIVNFLCTQQKKLATLLVFLNIVGMP